MKTEKALEKHSYLEVSMRKRMFLQLFEDGGGAGSGGQGGNMNASINDWIRAAARR